MIIIIDYIHIWKSFMFADVSNEDFEVFIQQGLLPLISSTAADDKELIDLVRIFFMFGRIFCILICSNYCFR